ncbi:hypothetical protein ACFL1X_08805 [Candidatus Hydrogenedentota bacterium]
MCTRDFSPILDEEDWKKISIKSSPSRSLSDLFWLKIDWEAVRSELESINVFDAGAGNGAYASKINDYAGGICTYLGTDVTPCEEWEDIMRKHGFVTLRKRHSHEILDILPKRTIFFMSQSAIEHFENDLLYFSQIKSFIDTTNNNTIQIHMFPSAACLRLYRFHGVRQYTPRTVSKIAKLFKSPNTYSILFRLGGANCNNLHYKFITYPLLCKKGVNLVDTRTEEYRTLLKSAVEQDLVYNNRMPSFHALVIHSNFRRPIFKTMGGFRRETTN